MPLMDEFKKEREDMKNQPFKKKLEYFWDYYKWWAIGGVAVIIAVIITISNIASRKNDVLYVAMVNVVANPLSDSKSNISDPFLSEHGYSTNKNIINFNTDFLFYDSPGTDSESAPAYSNTLGYSSRENLVVYVSAGDVDSICGGNDWMDFYAYNGFFSSVYDYLPEEIIEQYSDKIYYMDMAFKEELEKQAEEDITWEFTGEYPDGTKPEEMKDPVPIGVILDDSELFNNNFLGVNETKKIVMGMVVNSPEKELTAELIEYMLKGGF